MQIAEAKAAFGQEAPEGRLYTIHLLVNKRADWWTGNEDVRPIEGRVYRTRNEALEAADLAEKVADVALPGIPLCAGWTVHNPDGTWEVFEA
jgi:hypothetical protein